MRSPIARAFARREVASPANDNAAASPAQPLLDETTRAALRHFAARGLGAASDAQMQAELAHGAGNSDDYRLWLGICRALDRPLAARLERQLAGDSALIY